MKELRQGATRALRHTGEYRWLKRERNSIEAEQWLAEEVAMLQAELQKVVDAHIQQVEDWR